MLEQLKAGEHLARAAHEDLEHRELLGGELDLLVAPPDLVLRRIKAEVADAELRRALAVAASGERPQPGEQLCVGEGLHQVVVGPGVEARDAVRDAVARGQHQDRRPDAVVAQAPADLEAVDARQHQVEDDRVVLGRARHPEGVLALGGDVRGHPLLPQALADQAGHLGLVLDDQHAHLGFTEIVPRR